MPVIPETVRCFLKNIEQKIEDFCSESDQSTFNDQYKESDILKSIENVAISKHPKVKGYVFGSRIFLTNFQDSDIDVFIDCNDNYYTSNDGRIGGTYLRSVLTELRKSPEWMVIQVMDKAKTPFLKMKHLPTNLNCDLSFNNGLGVEKSKLVR